MANLHEAPFVTAPDELGQVLKGVRTLNAPFFADESGNKALQVGLQPDEYSPEQKEELTVIVTENLGRHAITLFRTDEEPFTVESSIANRFRKRVIDQAVTSLILEETSGPWMNVGTEDSEPLRVTDPEGFNYLAHIVTTFILRQQAQDHNRIQTSTTTSPEQ